MRLQTLIIIIFFIALKGTPAFLISNTNTKKKFPSVKMSVVAPCESSTVGVVGKGFISILCAKLAAVAGYKSWLLVPPGQEETITSLICDESLNVELIQSTDSDVVDRKLSETDAFMIAVDDDSTMDEDVIKYILDPDSVRKVKRVVAMSRNLNGSDMGLLVKASKLTANAEVWDNSKVEDYKRFEDVIKQQSSAVGAHYTIVRAGTLKGGACGENPVFSQYLSTKFYELTKKDIVTWQLLFDCNVRGVKLSKGDTMPGPGLKAIFTATATEACSGDSSRCAVAEAMIRSLKVEETSNIDFSVSTENARNPPTDEEWEQLFRSL
jgi:hypothetical protein